MKEEDLRSSESSRDLDDLHQVREIKKQLEDSNLQLISLQEQIALQNEGTYRHTQILSNQRLIEEIRQTKETLNETLRKGLNSIALQINNIFKLYAEERGVNTDE